MSQLHSRQRLTSEIGQLQSLASGREAFALLSGQGLHSTKTERQTVIFLGLGPTPELLPALFPEVTTLNTRVFYLESPEVFQQMPTGWADKIPDNFQAISRQDLPTFLDNNTLIWSHAQAFKLFPSFWGPILAQLERRELVLAGGAGRVGTFPETPSRTIILASAEYSLLRQELERAFQGLGYQVKFVPIQDNTFELKALLLQERPTLFLSLNAEGFGKLGENFYLLQELGVPCATWFVDNPWHNLSGLRSPFWKQVQLFCTDDSFIPGLKAAGAASVEPLPLAVDPQIFYLGVNADKKTSPEAISIDRVALPSASLSDWHKREIPLLFVGSASFPGKSGFFSGLSVPPGLQAKALELRRQGQRPDFHWWARQLGLYESPTVTSETIKETTDCTGLWPGKEARLAGLGAENASAEWRAECIRASLEFALEIFGDEGWHELLPSGTRINPPVDYYGLLPHLYASARFTLNATSLLLPSGLNQRHFDVWAAGGFLLTDYSPGLHIFPKELTDPVSFRKSSEIPGLLKGWLAKPREYQELQRAWRAEILATHTYEQRVKRIFEVIS